MHVPYIIGLFCSKYINIHQNLQLNTFSRFVLKCMNFKYITKLKLTCQQKISTSTSIQMSMYCINIFIYFRLAHQSRSHHNSSEEC